MFREYCDRSAQTHPPHPHPAFPRRVRSTGQRTTNQPRGSEICSIAFPRVARVSNAHLHHCRHPPLRQIASRTIPTRMGTRVERSGGEYLDQQLHVGRVPAGDVLRTRQVAQGQVPGTSDISAQARVESRFRRLDPLWVGCGECTRDLRRGAASTSRWRFLWVSHQRQGRS